MRELTPKDFNIVVPCFNEEKTVRNVLLDFLSLGVNRVIVVDDGSKDRTAKILKDFPVTVLTNKRNRGQGYSILRGLSYSYNLKETNYTITADADWQHKREDIIKVIEVASRYNPKLVYAIRMAYYKVPFTKLISNIAAQITLSYILRIKIKDPLCGLRAFRRDIIPYLQFRDRYEWAVDCAKFIDKNIRDAKAVYVKSHYSKYSLSKGLVLKKGFRFFINTLSYEVKSKFKKAEESFNYNQ